MTVVAFFSDIPPDRRLVREADLTPDDRAAAVARGQMPARPADWHDALGVGCHTGQNPYAGRCSCPD